MFLRNIPTVLTCITLLFAGCEALNTNNSSHWPEWDEHNRPPPELLEMKLVEVPDSVKQGQTVEFRMEVTNTSGQDYVLRVWGHPQAENAMGYRDFLVTGEENTLYWRFLHRKKEVIDGTEIITIPVSASVGVPLNAGESLELTLEWDGRDFLHDNPLEPGRYEVTGWYPVGEIWDKEGSVILDNYHESGMSHFTTEPKEIIITSSEEDE